MFILQVSISKAIASPFFGFVIKAVHGALFRLCGTGRQTILL